MRFLNGHIQLQLIPKSGTLTNCLYVTSISRHYSVASSTEIDPAVSPHKPKFRKSVDYFSPTPSILLNTILLDIHQAVSSFRRSQTLVPSIVDLAFGHHLLYFPPTLRLSKLLPDGTEPLHSPCHPEVAKVLNLDRPEDRDFYSQRLWAGGSISQDITKNALRLASGRPILCVEHVAEVILHGKKGAPGSKIFVTIERAISDNIFERTTREDERKRIEASAKPSLNYDPGSLNTMEPMRRSKLHKLEIDSKPRILERRTLVFVPSLTAEEAAAALAKPDKIIGTLRRPEHSQTAVITPEMLLRFSALTHNDHKIHLSKSYCLQNGYRDLLVHGPLSILLLTTFLTRTLPNTGSFDMAKIDDLNYRIVAPLYANEELTLNWRISSHTETEALSSLTRRRDPRSWQSYRLHELSVNVWITGRDGGLAVKGTATVIAGSNAAMKEWHEIRGEGEMDDPPRIYRRFED